MGVNIKKHMYLFFLFFLGVLFNLSTGVSYGAQVLHTSDKYITNRAREGQEISDSTIAGASQSDKKYPSLRFLKNYGKLVSWLRGKKKRYFTQVRSVYNSAQSRVQDNYLRYVAILSGALVGGSALRDMLSYVSKYISERHSKNALISAIQKSDVEQVKKLMKDGMSSNQKDQELIRAIEVGSVKIIEALIQGGADVNKYSESKSALYTALNLKRPYKIIKALLDAGATVDAHPYYFLFACYSPDIMWMMLNKIDPKLRDDYITDFLFVVIDFPDKYASAIKLLLGERELASILAKEPPFLHTMAERFRDNPDLLALLFRLGAPFNQENSNNETVLGAHVRRGDIGSVRQLFELSDRKNPNNKAMYENLGLDIVGSFILHQDCVGIVQGYLLNYCDVNEMDSMGRTLLGIALTSCPMSHKELMIQLLIERDANLNRASGGALPLYLCVQMCDHRNAIRERILTSLVKAKADPNVEVDSQVGDTILHRLSGNRLGSDVCPVLKYASDLEVRNKRDRTPLLTAVEDADGTLVGAMLDYHKDDSGPSAKPVNVHATIRETGDTALHIIALRYKDEKLKDKIKDRSTALQLIEAKALVDAKNLDGKTPLHLAMDTTLLDFMQRASKGEISYYGSTCAEIDEGVSLE